MHGGIGHVVRWQRSLFSFFFLLLWHDVSHMLCPKIRGVPCPRCGHAGSCHGPAQAPPLSECVPGRPQVSLSSPHAPCCFFAIERRTFRHSYLLFHLSSFCYLKEIEWIWFDRLAKYSSRHAR